MFSRFLYEIFYVKNLQLISREKNWNDFSYILRVFHSEQI